MTREHREYPTGLTVKELKEALQNWPETDKNGDAAEVWVMGYNDGLTNIVREITPLNRVDILLEP